MARFSAQVSKWVHETEKRQIAVYRISVQKVVNDMRVTYRQGGLLPIKTGNLRRSFLASTSSMPPIRKGVKEFTDGGSQIELVIAGAKITQTIYIGIQAEYGPRMNNGFTGTDAMGRKFNQGGFHFVDNAALKWAAFVDEAVREVRR